MSTRSKLTVMISSTARDLPEHRKQVMDACLALDMFPKMMEHLPASDADAIAASLRMVDEADVYLGIFAWRYGYVPEGHDISITEMEYNRAVERGIPWLLFIMHKDHLVTGEDVEKGPGALKLDTFKQRLAAERVANFFKSPEDLRAQVIHSLHSLAKLSEDTKAWRLEPRDDDVSPYKGLTALTSLLQHPAVHDQAVKYLADLQAASAQIDLLSGYKRLHDLLHRLEIDCYANMVHESVKFPEDETCIGILMCHQSDLEGLVSEMQEVATRTQLPSSDLTWIEELVRTQGDLQHALEDLDADALRRAEQQIKRVLDRYPARINERLNAAARTLRLDNIVLALVSIRDASLAAHLDLTKTEQFAAGVDALEGLAHQLTRLVEAHDRWQLLDVELRRIDNQLAYGLEELLNTWSEVKAMAAPLLDDLTEPWASALAADGGNLDAAIIADNQTKIRQYFLSYRRRVGKRFFRVDTNLKDLCDRLRQVGDPLAAVLKMLE